MKTSNLFPMGRTLICGLTLFTAPQIVRAQPQAQPRPPQSAINLNAKIALPAQFTAVQFFDALAKSVNTRFVVPIPDKDQLTQLNQLFGGRERRFPEIAGQYMEIVGYRFSNSTPSADLITVRLPDETLYPVLPVEKNSEPFLRLLVALSPAQIDQMYLRGYLTTQDLTPAQTPLYLEAVRANSNVSNLLPTGDKPPTDAQILAQPLHFRFAFQATALFTDDEAWPWLAVFDYGTGLIWNPLVGTDTKALATAASERPSPAMGQTQTVGDTSDKARATTVDYPQTQATTVGAAFDTIEQKLGQTLVFDANLYPKRLRATPIVISAGRYNAGELLTAASASAGLESRFYNDVPTLELRPPQQPMSQLPPLVEQSQQKLRRLSLLSVELPFHPSRFERQTVRFSELSGAEKFYLQARLLNEYTEGYDKIDLSKHTFRFANQLLFIADSGGPDSPFVTSILQLW